MTTSNQKVLKDKLEKAIEERDRYLKEHPDLKKYQDEVDLILEKTPEDKRMDVLSIMMVCKLAEMQEELIKMNGILNENLKNSL